MKTHLKFKWIGFVAGRYISRDRRNSPAAIFSVLGIAVGVLALIVIIAVMNGFQMSFIESILEISSGHIRVSDFPDENDSDDLLNQIRSVPGVVSAVPFRETSVLVRGRVANPRGALVRGLPPDALERDPGLASQLEMVSGSFDLHSPDGIVLGVELARHLSVFTGDTITVLGFSGGLLPDDEDDLVYTVKGIFHCGFYEYDLGWAFINIDRAAALAGSDNKSTLGIKLANRWQDQRFMNEISRLLDNFPSADSAAITSWRDYNRVFFGALRTEKLMMFILVGLIFIVVGLNIYQAQRRSVLERREEIGMLRALGATDRAVRMVFVLDGFIIGFTGAMIGVAAGLLVAFNISAFFSIMEIIVNFFINLINIIAGLFGFGRQGVFAIFSPAIFYIKGIPSRVVPLEVVLIFLFGFLSSLLAAFFASGRISKTRPAEILRYE